MLLLHYVPADFPEFRCESMVNALSPAFTLNHSFRVVPRLCKRFRMLELFGLLKF